jgi:hypothetical protein
MASAVDLLRRFVSDVEAAYGRDANGDTAEHDRKPDVRKTAEALSNGVTDVGEDAWFDLAVTYTDARAFLDRLDERGEQE